MCISSCLSPGLGQQWVGMGSLQLPAGRSTDGDGLRMGHCNRPTAAEQAFLNGTTPLCRAACVPQEQINPGFTFWSLGTLCWGFAAFVLTLLIEFIRIMPLKPEQMFWCPHHNLPSCQVKVKPHSCAVKSTGHWEAPASTQTWEPTKTKSNQGQTRWVIPWISSWTSPQSYLLPTWRVQRAALLCPGHQDHEQHQTMSVCKPGHDVTVMLLWGR